MRYITLLILLLATSCLNIRSDKTTEKYLNAVEQISSNNEFIKGEVWRSIEMLRYKSKRRGADYKLLRKAADRIGEVTTELTDYIDDISVRFLNTVDENDLSKYAEPTKKQWESQKYTHSFFIQKHPGRTPESENIKASLENTNSELRTALIQLLGEEPLRNILKDDIIAIQSGLLSPFKKEANWAEKQFENKSVAAAYYELALLENDALMTAHQLISFLTKKLADCDLIFDKYVPMSYTSTKEHIKLGESFETEVYLSPLSTQGEVAIKVDGKELPVEGGIATYKKRHSRVGKKEYQVEIIYKDACTGKEETYRKMMTYKVIENCQ